MPVEPKSAVPDCASNRFYGGVSTDWTHIPVKQNWQYRGLGDVLFGPSVKAPVLPNIVNSFPAARAIRRLTSWYDNKSS